MSKKVKIIPGCISCGTCEAICPAVFKVEGTAHVRNTDGSLVLGGQNVDVPDQYEDDVDEAAEMCPVSVIEVTDDE